MSDVLLKIVVNEQQNENREVTCKKIVTFLWEHGVPGVTMKRAEAGLDYQGNIKYDLLEDTYFNDLPIVIESVMDKKKMKEIEGELNQMAAHGQVSEMEGIDAKKLDHNTHYIVKVYTRESSKLIKKNEYEKVLRLLQKHNAVWGTVTKAIAGYGSERVIYNQHLFSFSEHLPLIIECIVEKKHLTELLAELELAVTEGEIFTAPVDLIINK